MDAFLAAGANVRAMSDNEEANTARADDGMTALAIAESKGHAQAALRLRGEMP